MGSRSKLSIEHLISFFVWISAILYSIYNVILASQVFSLYHGNEYLDVSEYKKIVNLPKDSADFEWDVNISHIKILLSWSVIYLTVSEIIRNYCIKVLPLWQVTAALLYILYTIDIFGVALILAQPIVFCVGKQLKSKLALWFCCLLSLFSINYFKMLSNSNSSVLTTDPSKEYLLVVSICWVTLKCLSYYLDHVCSSGFWTHLFESLVYSLYLPTLFMGPFIPYSDFKKSQQSFRAAHLKYRLQGLVCSLIRFGFWMLFTEFCLHYIYVNAFSYEPQFIEQFDSWTLYGYGYCMGQFFHLKYVVFYGFSTSIAKFENIVVPPTPKCIGRIHLYSDMWKYFDVGLYTFLIRYIYKPTLSIRSPLNKLLANFLCFTFVYVWHGVYKYVLIWTILNYLGIILEILFKSQHVWLENKVVKISSKGRMRIASIMAAPLLGMSAISNFYFFAGEQVGNIFFKHVFKDFWMNNAVLLLVLYCGCVVGISIKKKKFN